MGPVRPGLADEVAVDVNVAEHGAAEVALECVRVPALHLERAADQRAEGRAWLGLGLGLGLGSG